MPSQDNYEYHGLMVKYWDLLRGDTSTWADRFMYLELIHKYGQPVLDVGCASGRLILDYLAQKIDIDGVDISPEMIAMCERNAARKNFKPNLYVQNMTELSLPRKYRTILVPSSSIQLLLKPEQPQQAMLRFYEHLEPGGALVSPFMTLWREGDPLDGGFEQEALRPEDGATVRRSTRNLPPRFPTLKPKPPRYSRRRASRIFKFTVSSRSTPSNPKIHSLPLLESNHEDTHPRRHAFYRTSPGQFRPRPQT